ncbi:MAG: hypothetical protein SWX82_24965 [Cyanobacteriota bacterium]|nr:hypothetical protein [Cyanobacteriota bacterium]
MFIADGLNTIVFDFIEEGRRKKEEGRGKKEEGRGKREELKRRKEEEGCIFLSFPLWV